jgi:hypothetical protein
VDNFSEQGAPTDDSSLENYGGGGARIR